ncbi:tyrosine-type recombinase/integrase [Staphylococcus equorum]|uniref:tyrosine-type recombinase/integrase n=1 Tax=Staphylococcus equorum TaxID=246432 RepID=UPI003EBD6AE7
MIEEYYYKPSITKERIMKMKDSIIDPCNDDTWLLKNEFFLQFGQIDKLGASKNSTIRFQLLPNAIALEVKYFFYIQLSNYKLSLRTLYNYGSTFKRFKAFLNKFYKNIDSIIDIPFNKCLSKYKFYLRNQGLKSIKSHINFFTNYYDFMYNFFDVRHEFDKDIWDIRNIPHATVEINYSRYKLNFEEFHPTYKTIIKEYIWYCLTFKSSGRIYNADFPGLKCFVKFMSDTYRDWNDLKLLSRKDFENYLVYFHQYYRNCSDSTKHPYLSATKQFLEYLQRKDSEFAPVKPVMNIIFPEDIPMKMRQSNKVKHIPEMVIKQLQEILVQDPEKLKPAMTSKELEYLPVIILLISTGWRISDILNLRYDKCLLVLNNNEYYLQGDINKTKVNDHRVPIDTDVAMVIQTVIEATKAKSNSLNNPNKFLFVRTSGKRKGRPFSNITIQNNLNKWAHRYNIKDLNGEIYHFKNHAFRHSKGVELINLGMNITHVMKWFAHSSPEMTLVYARLADDTIRKEWLKALEKKGPLLKVDVNQGVVKNIPLDDDLIHWEYIKSNIEAAKVPLGYCMASKKEGCPFVITPCLDNCPNFCTTPEHISEFDEEIQNVKNVIERTLDMPIYNQKNIKQLDNLMKIKNQLKDGLSFKGDNAKKVLLEAQILKENAVHGT